MLIIFAALAEFFDLWFDDSSQHALTLLHKVNWRFRQLHDRQVMGELPLRLERRTRLTNEAVVAATFDVLETGSAQDGMDGVGVTGEPIIKGAAELVFHEVHGRKARLFEDAIIIDVLWNDNVRIIGAGNYGLE